MGKLKSIFELAENLSLVLTKLDTELGLAQPQLVFFLFLKIIDKKLLLSDKDMLNHTTGSGQDSD